VLIGVNPCLTERILKKQSQFSEESNERKVNYNKGIREIYWIGHLVKTKPIQSQYAGLRPEIRSKANGERRIENEEWQIRRFSVRGYLKKQSQFIRIEYSVSPQDALRRNPKDCVMRIAKRNLKKQSQFAVGLNWRIVLYERGL